MNIITDEDSGGTGGFSLETLARAAELCAESEGIDHSVCEVSYSLVSGEEIKELNRDYRGIDKTTDVLSFPQFNDPSEIIEAAGGLGEGESISLGDVVICEEAVRNQASEYGHSYERELVYLFVHSILHLMGYDHMEEEERSVMRAAEENIMIKMGLER